ncbi:hypothetical protein [Micromonospora inositola]|uniref:Uncharacterized protein n=1 Tax=Micromonospora inositola TaxID=47865 RepID=A0A1C5JNH5_9ACTN|nr:hypothetical protein [Micromonospora inositola]SCG72144.1 hypothetical protein GA0070613_5030 [Micromonospora inositola]
MDTSLGLQGSLLLLVAVGSAALTFVVPRPRLLWAALLAAVCGFCGARLGDFWDAMFGATAPAWPLLLAAVVLGAGFAWRVPGWSAMSAGWLGIPWGLATTVGVYWGLPCWNCGESYYGYWAVGFSVIGVVLTIVGAALTVALRVLIRRLRS